jgi:serralysin
LADKHARSLHAARKEDRMPKEQKWCFAWFAAAPPTTGAKKAAIVKGSKWSPGDTISISFLDGTEEQKALVRKFAQGWLDEGRANLKFSWQDPPDTDIRISFQFSGSWSVIGTTCRTVPKTQPTMNFGWLNPGISDDDARQVVLHEFGHALGLIHEHQNPNKAIQWNKPAVIADLQGPPNNWDEETIEHNMFEVYPPDQVAGTQLDSTSIMMYQIPKAWTLDGTSSEFNGDLSATDKVFIKNQYP